MPEHRDGPPRHAGGPPSALPSVRARAAAFATIVVAGLCGLLIGRALVELQCRGTCSVASGLGALGGAVAGAGGVAVVVVLVLRAMGDWQAGGAGGAGGGRGRS